MGSEYFPPAGGVCVASCHNKHCAEMRELAGLLGHSFCVCYQESIFDFNDKYREALEKYAKTASKVYVISDDGSYGKTQLDEMKLMDLMEIGYEKVTWATYRARYHRDADDQPSGSTAEDNGLFKGKQTQSFFGDFSGAIEEGSFLKHRGLLIFDKWLLVKGKRTWPDGKVEDGDFDTSTGKLINGKVTFPSGQVSEGDRDKATGNLINGKITFPSGQVEEGDRDTATGKLINGKITFPSGKVEEGDRDTATGKLINGKITFPSGQVSEGDRDTATGNLIKGKVTFPSGKVEEGDWDTATGKLIKGKLTLPSGKVEEGDWDPLTGKLLRSRPVL